MNADQRGQAAAPVPARSSILAAFKAVAWSFFGVRKGRDHQSDMERLNPIHVVIVGILLAVVFVLTLITIVRVVVG